MSDPLVDIPSQRDEETLEPHLRSPPPLAIFFCHQYVRLAKLHMLSRVQKVLEHIKAGVQLNGGSICITRVKSHVQVRHFGGASALESHSLL